MPIPCPIGKYADRSSLTACLPCAPGFYAPIDGSIGCIRCNPGFYQAMGGASNCVACEQGKFASDFNSTICASCPPGRYESNDGANECVVCSSGRYMLASNATYDCNDCSSVAGAICRNGEISAEPNYFVYSRDTQLLSAPCVTSACRGGALSQQCADHRAAPPSNLLCGACESGYSEWSDTCVRCDGFNVGMAVALLLLCWLYVLVIYATSQSSSGTFGIALYYVQTSLIIAGPSYSWTQWLSFVNFDARSTSNSVCVFPVSAMQKMILELFDPLLPVFQLSVTMLVHALLSGRCKRVPFTATSYLRALIAMSLYVYTRITQVVLRYLRCVEVADTWVVQSSPTINCDDVEYKQWRIYIFALVVTVVLGVPVGVALFLFRHRRDIIVAYDDSGVRLKPHTDVVRRFGILFGSYRRGAFWWQVVILLRRTSTVLILTYCEPAWGWTYVGLGLLHCVSLLIQIRTRPFILHHNNTFEAILLSLIVLIAYIILAHPSRPYALEQQVLLSLFVVVPSVAALTFASVRTLRRILYAIRSSCLKHGEVAPGEEIGDDKDEETVRCQHKEDVSMHIMSRTERSGSKYPNVAFGELHEPILPSAHA